MDDLFLIAGLGNPGPEYSLTRHNIGFLAVERLVHRRGARWREEKKFFARVARVDIEGRQVLAAEPQTFMNASGKAIQALAGYYKIPSQRLLVIVDDADLRYGEIRMRSSGSSGGHHGLESIEAQIGTRDFARLRVGIGRHASGVRQITNYVLGQFSKEESEWLDEILERAVAQAECWVTAGVQQAMNKFNGVVKSNSNGKG